MGTSNAAKNASKETHGGTQRFKLAVPLEIGTTRKQAESIAAKLAIAVKACDGDVQVQEYYTGGLGSKTLINIIEERMDGRRKQMEKIVLATGKSENNPQWVANKGRYEGCAMALSVLRSSSIPEEIERSNERLGIV